ncbi:hypothetical protein DFQ29_001175, partial [Apophysomyces sp. BC1021]
MKSKARVSLCRRIAAAITVAYEQVAFIENKSLILLTNLVFKRLTIAHTEVEALRTQRSVVTRSNKRMREAIEASGQALCEDSDPSFYASAEEKDQKEDCEDLRNKVGFLSVKLIGYPTLFSLKWVIDGIDLSNALQIFRKACRHRNHANKALDEVEILACNNIFLFRINCKEDCRRFMPKTFDPIIHQIQELLATEEGYYTLSKECVVINMAIVQLTRDPETAETTVLKLAAETKANTNERLISKVLLNLNTTEFPRMDESRFEDVAFLPFLTAIFPEDEMICHTGHFTALQVKSKRLKIYHRRWSVKADFGTATTLGNQRMECLFAEIKASVSHDLSKLGFEMQCALNNLVASHVPDPMMF